MKERRRDISDAPSTWYGRREQPKGGLLSDSILLKLKIPARQGSYRCMYASIRKFFSRASIGATQNIRTHSSPLWPSYKASRVRVRSSTRTPHTLKYRRTQSLVSGGRAPSAVLALFSLKTVSYGKARKLRPPPVQAQGVQHNVSTRSALTCICARHRRPPTQRSSRGPNHRTALPTSARAPRARFPPEACRGRGREDKTNRPILTYSSRQTEKRKESTTSCYYAEVPSQQ